MLSYIISNMISNIVHAPFYMGNNCIGSSYHCDQESLVFANLLSSLRISENKSEVECVQLGKTYIADMDK